VRDQGGPPHLQNRGCYLSHGYSYDDCGELGGQRNHLRELRLRAGEEESAFGVTRHIFSALGVVAPQ
jgi:hypothetical protein